MNFNFDFNVVKAGGPVVTVSSVGLAFNPAAVSVLGNAEKVLIGFDRVQSVIGVGKCAEGNDKLGISVYDFWPRRDNSGWVRLSMRDFIKYLTVMTEVEFKTSKQYIAEFDEETGTLLIFIDAKHLKTNVRDETKTKLANDDKGSPAQVDAMNEGATGNNEQAN